MVSSVILPDPCETAALIAQMHPEGLRGIPCDMFKVPTTYRMAQVDWSIEPHPEEEVCVQTLGGDLPGKATDIPMCDGSNVQLRKALLADLTNLVYADGALGPGEFQFGDLGIAAVLPTADTSSTGPLFVTSSSARPASVFPNVNDGQISFFDQVNSNEKANGRFASPTSEPPPGFAIVPLPEAGLSILLAYSALFLVSKIKRRAAGTI